MLVKTYEKYEIYCLTFSLGFLIYAKISLFVCYFWYMNMYLPNCYKNFMVASWMYVVATVIVIELIVEF
jgi:hypothetical protein